MGLSPKFAGNAEYLNACIFPPSGFVTRAVRLAMMTTAKRHGEFVAHLKAESSGLRETQMVRVRGPPSTDQAWFFGDKARPACPDRTDVQPRRSRSATSLQNKHGGVSMVDRHGEMARHTSRQATKKASAAKPLGHDADARAGAVSGGHQARAPGIDQAEPVREPRGCAA